MGLSSGEPPEVWNAAHPDRIARLYSFAVDAGSDLVLTNSFGGNAARLKLHNTQGRVRELNRLAAEIGRNVADKAGRPAAVCGSFGPTGDIFAPMGTLTHELAVEIFHEQAEGLKEGGADVLWVANGGCCGTMPVHLKAMHAALTSRPRGPRPSIEDITAKLGAFSSASDGTGGDEGPGRERKSRRRG